jgi:dTDP-4-dehydrorhamnose reductase
MMLLTGGSGSLGTELKKIFTDCYAPSHKELDICSEVINIPRSTDLIVHCAAYTSVVGAETDKQLCYDTNVTGTRNLARTGIPIIYISTEYVFDGEKGNYSEEDYPNPKNFYGLTKLLGEKEIREGVIIRTGLRPRPFEYPAAFIDQFTSADYADVIAGEIAMIVKRWKTLPKILHIGTGKKSVFELASKTRKVLPISRKSINVILPEDVSLNTKLWEGYKCSE